MKVPLKNPFAFDMHAVVQCFELFDNFSNDLLSAHRWVLKTGLASVNLDCASSLSTEPEEEPAFGA